jgi:hypothetical protein
MTTRMMQEAMLSQTSQTKNMIVMTALDTRVTLYSPIMSARSGRQCGRVGL